jgi:hypothetical protein
MFCNTLREDKIREKTAGGEQNFKIDPYFLKK